MNILGDITNPAKDVAALTPLADELEAKALSAIEASVLTKIIPALKAAGTDLLDGLTITITVTRKPPSP